MRLYRPQISSGLLSLLTAIYLLTLPNLVFWQKIFNYYDDHPSTIVVVFLILLLLYVILLLIFSAQYIIKPFFIALIAITAGASYFSQYFGTIITDNVIEATLTTTAGESRNLITPAFILHILAYGIIPSLLICWVKIKHRPFWKKVLVNLGLIFVCLIGIFALLATNFGSLSSLYREHRQDIFGHLVPAKPIQSLIKYSRGKINQQQITLQPYGTDAQQAPLTGLGDKKLLTVIVVGETARAQNFSLNGYEKETNPALKKLDIINFDNTTSCGTETAVSLPCMFSPFPRKEYSKDKFLGSENLVDVLKHAGLDVSWYENNTGTKNVGNRINVIDLLKKPDPRYCEGGECLDQVLLDGLKDKLPQINSNAVIVLHMTGSHGPAYFKRYPAEFAKFQPECKTAQFSDCTREQIVNSYDNSILYTDYILAQVIEILKQNEDKFASSMIYMSDHGESLGENGLYLHAAPYFIAPDTQTHIPFISWFSPNYAQIMQLDIDCVKASANQEASHDNLFHTVLGMMNVKTKVYEQSLDRFAGCYAPSPTK